VQAITALSMRGYRRTAADFIFSADPVPIRERVPFAPFGSGAGRDLGAPRSPSTAHRRVAGPPHGLARQPAKYGNPDLMALE